MLASDNERTFALLCYIRLDTDEDPVVGFHDHNSDKCQVKETSSSKELLRIGKIVYNLTPGQCNTNLTQGKHFSERLKR